MNAQQKKYCEDIGKGLMILFPEIHHGNICFQFNINREKNSVNMNVNTEYSEILSVSLKK